MNRDVRDDDDHQLLACDESGAWHLVFDLEGRRAMFVRFTPANGSEPTEMIVNEFLRTRYDDQLSRFAQIALNAKFALTGAKPVFPNDEEEPE